MKKYRLLKDMPGVDAGTYFINHPEYVNRWHPESEYNEGKLMHGNSPLLGLTTFMVESPNWFECIYTEEGYHEELEKVFNAARELKSQFDIEYKYKDYEDYKSNK